MLYICWQEKNIKHCVGPFWTVFPDGSGEAIGQNWKAYQVQTADHNFKRIIIPAKYHSIYFKQ